MYKIVHTFWDIKGTKKDIFISTQNKNEIINDIFYSLALLTK